MSKVIAYELEILGSHGMQAHRYEALFALIEAGKIEAGKIEAGKIEAGKIEAGKIEAGKIASEKLIGRTITLAQSIAALVKMDKFEVAGVTVMTEF
jgi:alcohol dehydrogenase